MLAKRLESRKRPKMQRHKKRGGTQKPTDRQAGGKGEARGERHQGGRGRGNREGERGRAKPEGREPTASCLIGGASWDPNSLCLVAWLIRVGQAV